MGAYIINVPDTVDTIIYVNIGDVYDGKTYIASQRVEDLTPYTEPDLEQVRADAYEDGYKTAKVQCNIQAEKDMREVGKKHYQKGLDDLWEAMQKAIKMYCEIDNEVFLRVFYDVKCDWGESVLQALFKNTPQHLIDSIRQYEQEKEEQITKGDIVLIKSTPEVEILVTYADEEYVSGIALTEVDGNCEIGDQYTNIRISNVEKTGKHYDIVSVLQKMKES